MKQNALSYMSRRLLGLMLLGYLAACDADTPANGSPGVKLVRNAVASGLPTVAEFGATTCSSCREMKIVLDSVANRTQGRAHVLSIDIVKDWEAGNAYRIQMMPTQVFFDAQGREVGRHIGKLSEAEVMTALGLGGRRVMDSADLIAAYPLAAAATALLAGVASSVSPCSVTAMPLVVGYVGGYSDGSRKRAVVYAASFVLGLSLAFTAVGLAVALAGAWLLPTGNLWRGILIMLALLAGISLLAGCGLPGLSAAHCGAGENKPVQWKGTLGAFITGALSGFVFAPCATPVMIGILALIGNQQDVLFGAALMFLYSFGHGALLLAAGSSVGFAQWMASSRWAGRVNWLFTRFAGALLVGYAIYLAAGMVGGLNYSIRIIP